MPLACHLKKLANDWAIRRRVKNRSRQRSFYSLFTERLENRTVPTTITVSNLYDTGAGSLRDAITQANANPGSTIVFGSGVTGSIQLGSGLPNITANMTISGPGSSNLSVIGGKSANASFDAFSISNGKTITISGITLSSFQTATNGGAIQNLGTLTLQNSIISGNSASQGAGIYCGPGSTTTIQNSTISGNSASQFGGGIYLNAYNGSDTLLTSVQITNSTITGNSATKGGAGIEQFKGNLTVTGSTFSTNVSAAGTGGALDLSYGSASITNSTFTGNLADTAAAIRIFESVTLSRCTISGNSAATSGSGLTVATSGVLNLQNSIVANNTISGNSSTSRDDIHGAVSSGSYNLIGDGSGMTGLTQGVNGNQVGTSVSPINPLLSALGSYGGSTQTMGLLPGSPAIQSGSTSSSGIVDQRGVSRPTGVAADIGSFESQGFTIAATSGSGQGAAGNTTFSSPLTATVNATATGEPVIGGLVTFTAPGSGASATFSSNPVTISNSGVATVVAKANSISGSYSVTASTRGATSAAFNLTNATLPSVTLQPVNNSVHPGDSVSFTVAASGSPTPTVKWQILPSGSVNWTDVDPSVTTLTYSFTAAYAQNGNQYRAVFTNIAGSQTSNSALLTVSKFNSTTAVSSSPSTSTYGQSVTFTATVSSGATGTAMFYDGSTSLGSGTINSGTATFSTSSLTTGNHSITAVYGGDSDHNGSNSSVTTQVVNTAPLSITATNQTKTYGFGNLGTNGFSTSGTLYGSDTVTSVTLTTNASTSTSGQYSAGSWSLTPSVALGTGLSNYAITYRTGVLTVNQGALTVSGLSGTNKTYDGTISDPVTGTASFSGLVTNDLVSLTAGTARFANANVGTGKTVTFSGYSISGTDSGNYTLSQPAASTADITTAPLTITPTNQTKAYGFGGTSTSLGTSGFTASGLQNGESVGAVTLSTDSGLSSSGNYMVGSHTLTASSPTGGTFSSSNYAISYVSGTLTVNQKSLTVTGLSGTDKTYDGTTSDPVTGTVGFSGLVTNDLVSLTSGTASFANANVGTAKPVTFAGYSISGTDSSNYTLSQPAISTANIISAPLTITATNQTKTYGFGGTSTSLGTSGFTTSGLQNGETVGAVTLSTDSGLSSSGNYMVGSHTLNASSPTGGTFSSSNYAISYVSGSLAVNQKALSVTGLFGTDKTYDGTNSDPVNGTASFNGLVTNDVVTLTSGTASFANANVGTAKPVTFSGYSISGTDSSNYTLSQPAASTANIKTAPLTITATNQTKSYGFGGTSASLGTSGFTASGLQNGEMVGAVTLSTDAGLSPSGNYVVGTHSLTASNATGGTFSSSNYAISYVSGTLTVIKAGTTTTLTSSANPSTFGSSVTFSATISGTANGDTVTFYDGSNSLGTGSITSGTAILSTSALTGGNHSITAIYAGNTNYTASTSGAVTQVIATSPIVTSNPTSQTVNVGVRATFTATGIGNPTPTVQWQISTDGGSTWANVTGATSSSYTTPATTTANDGTLYRAAFVNGLGSATTATATLKVNQAPTITTQPIDTTASINGTATFRAGATGTPAPTVKWQKSIDNGVNWTDIGGATITSYTTPTLAIGDSGTRYRAVFHNGIGADAVSYAATLSVAAVAQVTGTSIGWGISSPPRTASLDTNADGIRLLPAGRNTSIPWLNVNQITLTFSGTGITNLTTNDITFKSAAGVSYSVASITGSGTSWTINLANNGITNPDKLTVTIANNQIATYMRRLDVLPGDVNDDGVVNTLDVASVRNYIANIGSTTIPLVFMDINGDGSVTLADMNLVSGRNGKKLPV